MNSNYDIELQTNIDFNKYNAFFLGEFHGVYGVPEIKLALIEYLNKHYGITDVFMETSYSAAYLYNAYLSTGDTSYLVNPLLIYYMKQPYKEFFQKLYAYNKGLKHKIRVRGMDFERIEFLKVMKLLMPAGKEKPKDIYRVLAYIDTVHVPELEHIHTGLYDSQNVVYEKIRADMEHNSELYKKYYGENYKIVAEIMFNEDTYSRFAERNKTMYQNMMKQIEKDSIKKFITINGMNHGDKTNWKWKTLCYRLAQNPMFENKLADFALLCKNCYDWQLKSEYRYAAFRGPYTYGLDSLLVNNIYEKYDNQECKYTLIPTDLVDNGKVKKFSQYIILMKNQLEY